MFRSPQVKWNLISSITNINYGLRNELQNNLLRFSQEIRKLKNLKNLTAPPPHQIFLPPPPTKTPADKIIAHLPDALPPAPKAYAPNSTQRSIGSQNASIRH